MVAIVFLLAGNCNLCTSSELHCNSGVSSKIKIRSLGAIIDSLLISAFKNVVLPDPVPPTTKIFLRFEMASNKYVA